MDIIDKLGPAYVFADESGKLSDPHRDIVILASVIIYGARMARVNSYYKYLKEKISKWGIDVNDPEFEFHAADIFNRRKRWRKLTDEQLEKLAKSLRNAIRVSGLSFVLIKIDKKEKGFYNLLSDFDNLKKQGVSGLTIEQQNQANRLLAQLGITTGIGKLGHVVSLFFGLTTALMDWEEFKGDAKAIVDDQFLTGVEMWQLVYQLNAYCFSLLWGLIQPELEKNSELPKWPKNKPPEWHLGNNIDPKDSRYHFGLQLADFLAYTTGCLDDSDNSVASRYALLGKRDLISLEFGKSPGVWATTSSKPRVKLIPRSFATRRKWRRLIYRKVYSLF